MIPIVKLTQIYTTNRHYHDLKHINSMFVMAKSLQLSLTESQILAVWYHDVGFDITLTYQEQLNNSIKILKSHKYERKILETTSRHILNLNSDQKSIVADLNLIYLAFPNTFLSASQLIREEYSNLNTLDYLKFRESKLHFLLKKSSIFSTPKFQPYEAPAKKHCQVELATIADVNTKIGIFYVNELSEQLLENKGKKV